MRVDYSLVPVLLAVSYTWALRNHACGRLLGACPACGFLYLAPRSHAGGQPFLYRSCARLLYPSDTSPIPLLYLSYTPLLTFLPALPHLYPTSWVSRGWVCCCGALVLVTLGPPPSSLLPPPPSSPPPPSLPPSPCPPSPPPGRANHTWTREVVGPHRLVVRTSRCGRDNPGSTPGVDTIR
jgi:hypothetical protein